MCLHVVARASPGQGGGGRWVALDGNRSAMPLATAGDLPFASIFAFSSTITTPYTLLHHPYAFALEPLDRPPAFHSKYDDRPWAPDSRTESWPRPHPPSAVEVLTKKAERPCSATRSRIARLSGGSTPWLVCFPFLHSHKRLFDLEPHSWPSLRNSFAARFARRHTSTV